jgi:anti-anti-sigma factor
MDISTRIAGDIAIITITGSIDSYTYGLVSAAIGEQADSGQIRLLIDLSGVDFMSSAGLRALQGGLRKTREKGGDLRLAGAQAGVAKTLQISGFSDILTIYATVEQGLADFSK